MSGGGACRIVLLGSVVRCCWVRIVCMCVRHDVLPVGGGMVWRVEA